jgi:UDP-N-acetylmuramoyl-tripeptide--D-alanyl-D-alanine ligase
MIPTVAGSIVLTLRLLLISQREHYIAGRTSRVIWMWLKAKPWPHILLVAGASLLQVLLGGSVGSSTACFVLCVFSPVGFPLRQRDAWPKWTRRLRVLAFVHFAIMLSMVVTAVILGLPVDVLPLAIFASLLVSCELALRLTGPFEEVVAERYLNEAVTKLKSVNPRVVGITGSWGKTSTKNHLRDLIGEHLRVVASPASFNNQNGLSMTINEMVDSRTELLIAEIGMYGEGEIAKICDWLRPEVAVITAIGPMHLERVGSIDAIKRAKSEILNHAPVGVFWMGDVNVALIAKEFHLPKTVSCGMFGSDCNVEVSVGQNINTYFVHGETIGSLPAGELHHENVACAIGVALALNVPTKVLSEGLQRMLPVGHRAETFSSDSGALVIDDTFNSNPSGAKRALKILEDFRGSRRIVVTPGFFELGHQQAEKTREFVESSLAAGVEVIFVGYSNRRAVASLAKHSGSELRLVASRTKAKKILSNLGSHDAILWENDLPVHLP